MALNTYVDCSSHNGLPNLDAYWNAGHRELMMKATEGTSYYWPEMQSIARAWHAKGGTCGYYHWLHVWNATAQADAFWQKVAPVWQPGDWLMTDFEDTKDVASDATWTAALKQFNTLTAAHGPLHTYTGNWYIANKPLCAAYLKTQQVVMSDYSHSPPLNPYGLTYVAHQFTDKQTVAGFSSPVDYNRWITPPGGVDDVTPADISAIADAVYTKLLKTDGVLRAPADAADVATNPSWAWQSHIESSTLAARGAWRETVAAKPVLAAVRADLAAVKAQLAGVAKSVASGDAAVIADIGTRVAELQAAVAALPSAAAGSVDATAVVDELASRLSVQQ